MPIKIKKWYRKDLGYFQLIGTIENMHSKDEELPTDVFSALAKVSKSAFSLFNDLKDTRDPHTNLCFISTEDLNASEKRMWQKKLRELIKAKLVKRAKTVDLTNPIKKGSIMINPRFIICPYDQDRALALWDRL